MSNRFKLQSRCFYFGIWKQKNNYFQIDLGLERLLGLDKPNILGGMTMQCPLCSCPDYIFLIRIEWPNASAAKLIDQPFRQCAEARVLPSKSRIKCYNLKDLDLESSAASWECIKGEVYCCLVQAAKQLLATWTRSEICTFIEIDKLFRFVTNKDWMLYPESYWSHF